MAESTPPGQDAVAEAEAIVRRAARRWWEATAAVEAAWAILEAESRRWYGFH